MKIILFIQILLIVNAKLIDSLANCFIQNCATSFYCSTCNTNQICIKTLNTKITNISLYNTTCLPNLDISQQNFEGNIFCPSGCYYCYSSKSKIIQCIVCDSIYENDLKCVFSMNISQTYNNNYISDSEARTEINNLIQSNIVTNTNKINFTSDMTLINTNQNIMNTEKNLTNNLSINLTNSTSNRIYNQANKTNISDQIQQNKPDNSLIFNNSYAKGSNLTISKISLITLNPYDASNICISIIMLLLIITTLTYKTEHIVRILYTIQQLYFFVFINHDTSIDNKILLKRLSICNFSQFNQFISQYIVPLQQYQQMNYCQSNLLIDINIIENCSFSLGLSFIVLLVIIVLLSISKMRKKQKETLKSLLVFWSLFQINILYFAVSELNNKNFISNYFDIFSKILSVFVLLLTSVHIILIIKFYQNNRINLLVLNNQQFINLLMYHTILTILLAFNLQLRTIFTLTICLHIFFMLSGLCIKHKKYQSYGFFISEFYALILYLGVILNLPCPIILGFFLSYILINIIQITYVYYKDKNKDKINLKKAITFKDIVLQTQQNVQSRTHNIHGIKNSIIKQSENPQIIYTPKGQNSQQIDTTTNTGSQFITPTKQTISLINHL